MCFAILFHKNVPTISSPLRSLITYVHGALFLTFLITKISSGQFGVYPLGKMFLYFDILTTSSILNLGSLLLISLPKSIYELSLTLASFHFDFAMIRIVVFIYYII